MQSGMSAEDGLAGPSTVSSDARSLYAASMYSAASPRPNRSAAFIRSMERRAPHSADLKTVHTYSGAHGTLRVQLLTPPQASPTYMGGTHARGRGAMTGRILLECTSKMKASEVRIKLRSVVIVMVPRTSQATEGPMPNFNGLAPSHVSTSKRELVLLQLDQRMRASDALYRPMEGASPTKNAAGRLDRTGLYEWTFTFDIPEQSSGKSSYSTGNFPGVGTYYPSSYLLESDGAKGRAREEWASVKWYIKVTVERPGLFRSNDRVIVPFIYLPPPPDSVSSTLIQRQALSAQIQTLVRHTKGPIVLPKTLAEPATRWRTAYFQLNQLALGKMKRSFVDKLTGSNKPKEERWAISLPSAPLAVYPLRAVIPLMLTLVHSAGMPLVIHPFVTLVQKVHLRARSTSTHSQIISIARMLPSPVTKTGLQQWFGYVQFPTWCSPSFDTNILGLEYCLQVRPLNTTDSTLLTAIPVGLFCAPPRLAQQMRSVARPAQHPIAALHATSQLPTRPQPADSTSISSHPRPADAASMTSSGSPSISRLPSVAQGRGSLQSVPEMRQFGYEDPAAAGVAGIGRTHLPGTVSMPASPHMYPRHTGHLATGAAAPDAAPLSPTSPIDSGSSSRQTSHAPAHASESPAGTGQDQATDSSDAVSIYGPPVHEDLGYMREPPLPNGADAPGDHAVQDAGPLTQEQEFAWTMDILANAFNDDDVAGGIELPPSYFEATGIQDNEE